jgi:hypothetical protein
VERTEKLYCKKQGNTDSVLVVVELQEARLQLYSTKSTPTLDMAMDVEKLYCKKQGNTDSVLVAVELQEARLQLYSTKSTSTMDMATDVSP